MSAHAIVLGGGLLTLAVAVLLTAWVSDDALISLRTIDQLLHGRGLRFNALERVQAFTHPLWLLWLTPFQAVSGEGLWSTLVASWVCMAAAVAVGVRLCGPVSPGAWAFVLALVSSKSVVDYATSGLESPLTDLLFAAFAAGLLGPARDAGAGGADAPGDDRDGDRLAADRWRVGALSLCSALLFLDRMDAVLLIAPAAAWLAWAVTSRGRLRATLPVALAGLLPALAWMAFSALYFGSLWPNTAYAKLSTGIGQTALLRQGLTYLHVSVESDPAGALVLAAGVVVGVAMPNARVRALALGLAAYVAYTAWIGGDFMVGRFLAAPVFGAALLLGWCAAQGASSWRGRFGPLVAVAAVCVSAASPTSPLRASPGDTYALVEPSGAIPAHGVVDERLWYYTQTGALSAHRTGGLAPRSACHGAGRVRLAPACGGLGRTAYESCADDHWIDSCALADAFLARLPVADAQRWRIGHFQRAVPRGYVESVRRGRAAMDDAALDALFEWTRLRVRAPVFSRARLRALVDGAPSTASE